MLTKEMLAEQLNGSEYPLRPTHSQENQMKAAGLVVVYGASDNLMEFCGCISDEFGCYNGGTAMVDKKGFLPEWEDFKYQEDDEAEYQAYFARKPFTKPITAIWGRDGISWQYDTEIPHATFEIKEDGETYCIGIVFDIAELH